MKKFYTVRDAARAIGVSTNTIYKYLDQGKLVGKRFGKGRFKIPSSEIIPFLPTVTQEPVVQVQPEPPTYLTKIQNVSYQFGDFCFYKLFLALIFVGNGILTFFYRFSVFTPYNKALPIDDGRLLSSLFLIIPLFSLIPGIMLFMEVFRRQSKKFQFVTHLLTLLVSGYSAYFSFAFGSYEPFSFFASIFIVQLFNIVKSVKYEAENDFCFFEKEFLKVVILTVIIWGITVLFIPNYFPISIMKELTEVHRVLLVPIIILFVGPPFILLMIPGGQKSLLDIFTISSIVIVTIILSILFSGDGKWITSFYLYVIAVFEIFLLWWRSQEEQISFKMAPIITLALFWLSIVVLTVVMGVSFSQKAVIDSNIATTKSALSRISREIDFIFETMDRRMLSVEQKGNVLSVINEIDSEASIYKAKEIFDVVGGLRRVVIVDPMGFVVGAYPRENALTKAYLGDREYFKQAKSSLKPFTSDIFTAVTGFPVVTRIYPLELDDEFAGAVIMVPDLARLSRQANITNNKIAYYGYDYNNDYLLHPESEKFGLPVPEDVINNSSEGIYRDINLLRVYEKNTNLGWTFYGEVEIATMLNNFLGINVIAGIIILVGAIVSISAITLIKKWSKI